MLNRWIGRFLHQTQATPRVLSLIPFNGPLFKDLARVSPVEAKIPISIIPRRNPFLKPAEVWLRNFQTFKPVALAQVSAHLLAAPIRKDIMHRVVVWYRAGLRAGTASSKARGEVRGSNRKIRPQKGAGKARAGSSRAPQRRGGGRVFGPKPRDFSFSLSPKIRALGLRSALTAKYQQSELTLIDESTLQLESHKTAQFAEILGRISAGKKILVLDSEPLSRNIQLASRSLNDRFEFMNVTERSPSVNAYHVLNCSMVLVTKRAADYLDSWLTKGL